MMMDVDFDVCVVGGGMSGLYFAKKLREREPHTSLVVLEADPSGFGGRARASKFAGTDVLEGAGVARVGKDRRLIGLMEEMKVKSERSDKDIRYSPVFFDVGNDSNDSKKNNDPDDLRKFIVSALRTVRARASREPAAASSASDFREFAVDTLGADTYDLFARLVGFTDFEKAAVYDTLADYGFDDNYSSKSNDQTASVKWNDLVKALVQCIQKHPESNENEKKVRRLIKGALVERVRRTHTSMRSPSSGSEFGGGKFVVTYSTQKTQKNSSVHDISCARVVFATTVPALTRLYPRSLLSSRPQRQQWQWQHHLRAQPFMRLYARVDRRSSKAFTDLVTAYTVVPNELQKVIPTFPEKGVYMAAYSDNENADALLRMGFAQVCDDHNGAFARTECADICVDVDAPSNEVQKQHLCRLLERLLCSGLGLPLDKNSVKVLDVRGFYWRAGTHYYVQQQQQRQQRQQLRSFFRNGDTERRQFLRDSLHPEPGVTVLGEGFSREQGWTEGALTRVDEALASW